MLHYEVKEEVFKHNPNAEFIDEAIVEDYILSLWKCKKRSGLSTPFLFVYLFI